MNYDSLYAAVQKLLPTIKAEDFEIVKKELSTVTLKKNEIWEQEGKISQWMGFIHSGILRQYYIKDGIEFTIDFFMENDFVGNYISYEHQQPSQTITSAIESCELFVIPFSVFQSFYKKIPSTEAAAKIVGDQKILKLHERNSSLLMDTPEERYNKLVVEKPNLINRVPQYLIAQYLGIRPESLSRIRKRYLDKHN